MTTDAPDFGDYAIFGVTQDPEFLSQELPRRLGITPRTIDFGVAGTFFFYSSYGDTAETEEAIALSLGFVRSQQRTPLSALQLLEKQIVGLGTIDSQAFYGSATVASFSKQSPKFSVYETLLVSPPLYYTHLKQDSFLCATNVRALLALLDRVELNEDAIPMHFLFEAVVGPVTYFKEIFRLFPGQMLIWDQGDVTVKLVQNFQPPAEMSHYNQLDDTSLTALERDLSEVLGVYLADIKQSGHQSANLLSGGVDSSVLQLLLNQHVSDEAPLSYSYAVKAGSFDFEVEYARHASELFNTNHTYFDILPQDFPGLLTRTIELLGQPNLMFEGEVGKLALAEALSAHAPDIRYFFTAQGADGVHGMAPAKKMALFDRTKQIPGAHLGLSFASRLVSLISDKKGDGLREVAELLVEDRKPDSFLSPMNISAIAVNLDTVRHYFGDAA
ncbi:MAG: asparagine synthase-related protein, partial [Chloroflexota bacterium]